MSRQLGCVRGYVLVSSNLQERRAGLTEPLNKHRTVFGFSKLLKLRSGQWILERGRFYIHLPGEIPKSSRLSSSMTSATSRSVSCRWTMPIYVSAAFPEFIDDDCGVQFESDAIL